jgi:hypothetical protein
LFVPFLFCYPASLPDHPLTRLRPIDAGDRNELPAISRDPNVIGGGCNTLMRSPHVRSLESQSRPLTGRYQWLSDIDPAALIRLDE